MAEILPNDTTNESQQKATIRTPSHTDRTIGSLEWRMNMAEDSLKAALKDIEDAKRSIAELQAAALDLCERGRK